MLLDTHVWVWAVDDDRRRLGPKTRRLLARVTGKRYLSSMSVFEVAALHTADRLQFTRPLESWVRESIDRGQLRVVMVSPGTAVDAGLIPASAIPDPIDRLLIATARELDVPLVTRDRPLIDYARTSGMVRTVDASK